MHTKNRNSCFTI